MEGGTNQALRFAENLSLPSVQVIVMRANMRCSHCRQRVSQIMSRMNGFLDYVEDLSKKEVTVRGMVNYEKNKSSPLLPSPGNKKNKKKKMKNRSSYCLGLLRLMCFKAF